MRISCERALIALAAVAVLAVPGRAATGFAAILSGSQEVPARDTPATGYGTVLLNDAENLITVDMWWQDLTVPLRASHIHTGAAGTNGPVTFDFLGEPATTSGVLPTQSFAINAAQVATLKSGGMYFNLHTATYPGGEIRGQIGAVPEPATFALLGSAALPLLGLRRRRK